jgi:hypothetical protein
MDMIREFMEVNMWFVTANDMIFPSVLDKYSDERLDWLNISYRKDLTVEFIKKHIDKLCIDIILLNYKYPSDIWDCIKTKFNNKFSDAILRAVGNSEEVIKSECYIKYHIEKMYGGWDTVSKLFLMSDDFMIENWDNLNKDLLKKYRKLSPRIQALL